MQEISLFIYNIIIRLYALGIFITSPFNKKARLWIEGRKKELPNFNLSNESKRIWVHCASLGEFEQARPVIEKIKNTHPQHQIILSFFSPSGYEIRKNYEYADVVTYLPLDTKSNAQKFIAKFKPDLALFVKYEFWYYYLYQLNAANIPVILFSAVFRKNQVFFKWYGTLFQSMLAMFSKILVQNNESKQLLKQINNVEAEIIFDTRIDRVHQIAENRKPLPLIEKFKGGSKIFIAGSTWPKDEELILPLINEGMLRSCKYIIAPHEVSSGRIKNLQKNIHFQCVYLSQLTEANASSAHVILVDSIGQLSSLYAYCNIAYIGGAFNAGVHNILEAAVYGVPVIFGPDYLKSVEAKKLVTSGAAFSIYHYKDLLSTLRVIDERNRQPTNMMTKMSKKYVTDRLGGTEQVYACISAWL